MQRKESSYITLEKYACAVLNQSVTPVSCVPKVFPN